MVKRRQPSNDIETGLAKARVTWRRTVQGTLDFLRSLPHCQIIHGERWRQKMREYYSKRLVEMLAHPPAGCEVEAKKLRKALNQD